MIIKGFLTKILKNINMISLLGFFKYYIDGSLETIQKLERIVKLRRSNNKYKFEIEQEKENK